MTTTRRTQNDPSTACARCGVAVGPRILTPRGWECVAHIPSPEAVSALLAWSRRRQAEAVERASLQRNRRRQAEALVAGSRRSRRT